MKKKVKGLSRMEKRKVYGGDKTIIYEKMGLIEESDIEKYRKKLGIKKEVDLINTDVSLIIDEAAEKKKALSRRGGGFYANKKKDLERDEFKKIIQEFKDEK